MHVVRSGDSLWRIAKRHRMSVATLARLEGEVASLERAETTLGELEARRAAILESVGAQGKLDDALKGQILAADTKARLEDLYLPYKPKRRTKAQIAREAGLEPLADQLLADPTLTPEEAATAFFNTEAGFTDAKTTLDGARQILMERFSEDAALVGGL